MFDTKNYYTSHLGCQCASVFCYHCYPEHPFRATTEQVLYDAAFNRGYATGRREAYEELEKERTRFRNATDQEKFTELLKVALVPLDELRENLKV